MAVTLFHGCNAVVEEPGIRLTPYTMDFSWGFYCTKAYEPARRQASRYPAGVVNRYTCTPDPALRVLRFDGVCDAWLEFVGRCRGGFIHDYDIVEGPMADDSVFDAVNMYLAGEISKEAFHALVRGKHPAEQISFHTMRALCCLTFEGSEPV